MRNTLRRGLSVIAIGAALCAACGSSLQRGPALYQDGYYVEAAEAFERTEVKLRDASVSERATYGLYRGLTFLELDDLRHAATWLRFGADNERVEPGSLSPTERRALEQAWLELGERVREEAYEPDPSAQLAAVPRPDAPSP